MKWIRQYCNHHNLSIRHLPTDGTIILWDGKQRVGEVLEHGKYVKFKSGLIKSSDLATCIISNCKIHR